MSKPDQSYTPNLLLRAMRPEDFALLQPALERIDIDQGEALMEAGALPAHVYFPEGGVVSTVALRNEKETEIGVYGREGMSASHVLLGVDETPHRSLMQVGGATALVIDPARLREACARSDRLAALLLRYIHVMTVQTADTAVSNARQELPERLARWLLMCHDRVEEDAIEITHAFLSVMLGVRRAGVTVALHRLEGLGAISASRGRIAVRDRKPLEALAGPFYGRPESEYRRLIAPFGKARAQAGGLKSEVGSQ